MLEQVYSFKKLITVQALWLVSTRNNKNLTRMCAKFNVYKTVTQLKLSKNYKMGLLKILKKIKRNEKQMRFLILGLDNAVVQ